LEEGIFGECEAEGGQKDVQRNADAAPRRGRAVLEGKSSFLLREVKFQLSKGGV